MLLGLESRRKADEETELESTFFLGSQLSAVQDEGDCSSETCKDVDVVSVVPGVSASTLADSLCSEIHNEHHFKDQALLNSRNRNLDDCTSSDYDSGNDASSVASPSIFDFQKGERFVQRVPLSPFSKPAPSKWDDAQKWIASPNLNRPKMAHSQLHIGQALGSKKLGILGYGSRQQATKVLVEVPEQRFAPFGEPDTKRIDMSQVQEECVDQKFVNWEIDPYLGTDSYGKSVLMIESSAREAAVSLSQHDSSISIHSAATFVPPPSTARSVSMRDMGTEMTPIASQEPSRTGTPVRETTPMRSPTSSRPSTPGRTLAASPSVNPTTGQLNPNKKCLSEKEIQKNTKREIMALGKQLGKTNIAAWASKEEEDTYASASLKHGAAEQPPKTVIETRAAAWEEAEKAKYLARFKREEIKIEAWENHQKAKTQAEMRKSEVEVERIRGQAHDKLMNKLAALRHKAEEKRAAAEAKRNRQAAKTEQQAEYIRRTGQIPSSFSWCSWCL